jgi:hypothetical protein
MRPYLKNNQRKRLGSSSRAPASKVQSPEFKPQKQKKKKKKKLLHQYFGLYKRHL